MATDLSALPYKLKSLRETAGHSQWEFARMCGLAQAQISAYELGKNTPNLETAIRIAASLGITVAALIGETEPHRAPPRPATRDEMALWVIEAIGIDGFKLDQLRRILKL